MKNVFADTNVLVYAAEEKSPIARKTVIARELLLLPGLHISVQVLNEFIATARNRNKLALPPEAEAEWIAQWLRYPIETLCVDTFLDALGIHQRYQLSHWDSLIVATANRCGCETLYTEDMGHGQIYDGVRVINPFR